MKDSTLVVVLALAVSVLGVTNAVLLQRLYAKKES